MRSTINDYFFYKIVNVNGDCDNLCYVGSTANWSRRLQCHKGHCHNENAKQYNYKVYQTIRANGGWHQFKMIEIGTAEQLTQRQAHAIEEDYRIALKADMNDRRCFVAGTIKEYKKQYNIDNAEKIREQQKQYYIDNAEKIREQQKQYDIDNAKKIKENKKQYRIDNAEQRKQYLIDNAGKIKEQNKQYCIDNVEKVKEYRKQYNKQYNIDNVERVKECKKQYYIDNVEKIKEQHKQYRIDNKSKISAHKKEKHNCACGGRYTTGSLLRHNKTKKHQTYIKNNPIKIDTCVQCEN